MPLELLVPMVVLGVALTLFVTHALGGSCIPPVEVGQATATFTAEHPGLSIQRVEIDRSGRTAVVLLEDGRVGVVTRIGDHLTVKIATDAARVQDRLRLRFGDVGWPMRDVHLGESERSPDDAA